MENSGNVVSPKQQIVERIKQSSSILVTVSSNPSVDALSAAIAMTLMLNKIDKHATAVFSGAIPPAIKFLEPDKTFQHTVDSLRDFIIALDKDKADRLRYKVEDDVVKIYITPYRYNITEKDLRFSQGDFNVDMILALGVEKREELDRSVAAHGRILHDASVMTINAANQKSTLGTVDWQDSAASSLSEMLVSVSEALQPGLLDPQISTALLTGIVAATDRFSNQRTTPRVMTMAAQLMAAGANQQLIASNLRNLNQGGHPGGPNPNPAGQPPKDGNPPQGQGGPRGEMVVKHNQEAPKNTPPAAPSARPPQQVSGSLRPPAPAAPAIVSSQAQPTSSGSSPDNAGAQANRRPKNSAAVRTSYVGESPIEAPAFGGTLNATAQEALEDKMREETDQRNKLLLTHVESTEVPEPAPPVAETVPPPSPPAPPEAEASLEAAPLSGEALPPVEPVVAEASAPQLSAENYDNQAQDIAAARAAVDQAFAVSAPLSPPNPSPEQVPVEPLAPAQSTEGEVGMPSLTPPPESGVPAPPVQSGEYAALPPLPDFSTLPPAPGSMPPALPPIQEQPAPLTEAPVQPQAEAELPQPVTDPAQFKIPGSA